MFARFNENPAMILQDIKETKRYGRTDTQTDGQRKNSIPPTNKVCGGYKNMWGKDNFNMKRTKMGKWGDKSNKGTGTPARRASIMIFVSECSKCLERAKGTLYSFSFIMCPLQIFNQF